jgi:hypothetical protein
MLQVNTQKALHLAVQEPILLLESPLVEWKLAGSSRALAARWRGCGRETGLAWRG